MSHPPRVPRVSAACLPLLAIALATPVVAQPAGTLETAAGTYTFVPKVCAIHTEDGQHDIEVAGPGTAPDGEKLYFELSSTAGAFDIGLGVDTAFATASRQLKAGRYVTQEFTLQVSGRTLSADGLVVADENGKQVDTQARLRVTCGG